MRISRSLALSLLTIAGAVTLAGCAPPASRWSAAQAPRQNHVDYIRLSHAVAFAHGSTRLDPAEAARLGAFLSVQKVGYGDRVSLIVDRQDGRLAKARQAAVAKLLAGQGVSSVKFETGTAPQVFPNQMTLVVGRYVVTPPACPDWSKPTGSDITNTVGANFGCATAVNLGLMVADPGDLVQGQEIGAADGTQSTLGVQRYREGKVFAPSNGDTRSTPQLMTGGGAQ